jgi:hypothetical protein
MPVAIPVAIVTALKVGVGLALIKLSLHAILNGESTLLSA